MNSDRPWMTALEMQVRAAQASAHVASSGHPGIKSNLRMHKNVAAFVPKAIPYAWESQSARAVRQAAASIPADARLSVSTIPQSSWWWFDEAVQTLPEYEDNLSTSKEELATFGILLVQGVGEDGSPAASITAFGLLNLNNGLRVPHPIAHWNWRDQTSVDELLHFLDSTEHPPDSLLRFHVADISRFVIAACVWLEQKILVAESGHLERHRRKQLAREFDIVVSEVKVIQLRRAETHPSAARPSNEPVDWSCRWIVNGHWRNQPYKDEKKLIYIMPFVKGPADKPLKVPTHTVYEVSR